MATDEVFIALVGQVAWTSNSAAFDRRYSPYHRARVANRLRIAPLVRLGGLNRYGQFAARRRPDSIRDGEHLVRLRNELGADFEIDPIFPPRPHSNADTALCDSEPFGC